MVKQKDVKFDKVIIGIYEEIDEIWDILSHRLVYCNKCGAVFKNMNCANSHEKLCNVKVMPMAKKKK